MKKLCLLTMLFATCALAQVNEAGAERDAATRLGHAIEKAFNDRDAKQLTSLINARELALRAARVAQQDPKDQEAFARGVEARGLSTIVAGYFRALDADHGSARFIRATNTRPSRALVRLDLGENGFDYLEYIVDTREGRTRTSDWFQLSTGELITVTAGGIARMFTTDDPGVVARMFGVEKVDTKALEQMRKVGELQRAGRFAEALAALQQLPEPMANSRILLSAQASLAMFSKQDEEYARVLAKLAEKYSDDPAAAFKLLDHYVATQDIPKMLKCLDTIEQRIGVDGVTRHLRATAYILGNDFAPALKFADESVQIEPDRLGGYDIRASALVGLNRYADAVAQYRDMEKQFGLQFTRDVFDGDPFFAKFAKSKELQSWLPK